MEEESWLSKPKNNNKRKRRSTENGTTMEKLRPAVEIGTAMERRRPVVENGSTIKKRQPVENGSFSPFFRPKSIRKFAPKGDPSNNYLFNLTIDNFAPTRENDLAIHSKKLEELKGWLRSRMGLHRGTKTLLLTGPSGSGKTSAVRVLCAELGIELNEYDWTEELEFDRDGMFRNNPAAAHPSHSSETQLDGFLRFLHSAEFGSIEKMSLKQRLLLIGQLPNAFYHDSSKLHTALAEVVPKSRCMLVFVLTNVDSCWELSPVRMFPSPLVEQLRITHLKFNPVSVSSMGAAMKRAFGRLNMRWDAELSKRIVNSANGDIRRAMNSLLFTLIGTADPLMGIKISRQPPQLADYQPVELFHFIGKVLYAKREMAPNHGDRWIRTEGRLLPKVRKRFHRPVPPKDDLNHLIASAPITGQMLANFVHEHEPRFAPSLSALRRMSTTIAGLDKMSREVGVEQERMMDKYTMDIVIRASLFNNYRPANKTPPRRTFYQFDKSRYAEVDVQRREMRFQLAQLMPTERSAQMETLILPMMAFLHPHCTSKAQLELLSRCCLSKRAEAQLKLVAPNRQTMPNQPSIDMECCSSHASGEEVPQLSLPSSQDSNVSTPYSIGSCRSAGSVSPDADGFNYDIEDSGDDQQGRDQEESVMIIDCDQ